MHGFVESYETRDLAERDGPRPRRHRPGRSCMIDGAALRQRSGVARTPDTTTPSRAPTACGWCRCGRRWPPPASRPQPVACLRALPRLRPGADAGRAASAATRRRRGTQTCPLEPGGPLAVALITGRLRPVRHRHRHAHRGQPRLRLGPSVHRAWAPASSRCMTGYIHTIYPRQTRQLQDGLAAADGRRHQRRRQHLHRRLARPQARHAAGAHDRHPRTDGAAARRSTSRSCRQQSLLADAGLHRR